MTGPGLQGLADHPETPSTAGLAWVKSSFSFDKSNCVEVAELSGGGVAVRDSKDAAGPVLAFDWGTQWLPFVRGIRMGLLSGAPRPSPVSLVQPGRYGGVRIGPYILQ